MAWQAIDNETELQRRLLDLTKAGYWTALRAWSKKISHLKPAELALVSKASTQQEFLKTLPKDYRKLALISRSAEDEGFRHRSR